MFRKLYIAYYCYYAFQFNTRHRTSKCGDLALENENSFVCMCWGLDFVPVKVCEFE